MFKGQRWLALRRGLDVLVVLAASPVLLPLGCLAMAAVFLEDRQSPLIKLARAGRGGDPISVTKIRSMRVAKPEDEGAAVTSGTDDRITRTGRALRSWRLDEIPQVWQVLTGQMALIGPRPEDPRFVDLEDTGWQKALRARPAIAGLTQILASPWEEANLNGADAEAVYANVAVPAKVAVDAWYAENASPALDWAIVTSLADHFLRGATTTRAHRLAAAAVPEAALFLEPAVQAATP